MPVITTNKVHKNVCAMLDLIAYCEGTDDGKHKTNNHGYDVLVGHGLFTDYSTHPLPKPIKLSETLSSTAAGRYQLLNRYYAPYCGNPNVLGHGGGFNFEPLTQDLIAIQQMRERGAIPLLEAGNITEAINRCNNIWASLPGSKYGQRTVSMGECKGVFLKAGGVWA